MNFDPAARRMPLALGFWLSNYPTYEITHLPNPYTAPLVTFITTSTLSSALTLAVE